MLRQATMTADLRKYVGIRDYISSPFHLYLRDNDVERWIEKSPIRYIRFVIFSMGSRKVVLIGVYDIKTESFNIESSCKYHLRDLIDYLHSWEEDYKQYTYVARNRILETGFFVRGPVKNYDQYLSLKYYLSLEPTSIFYKKEHHSAIRNKINYNIIDDFLDEPIDTLDEYVQEFESSMNLQEAMDKRKEGKIRVVLTDFFRWIQNYNSFILENIYSSLPSCTHSVVFAGEDMT